MAKANERSESLDAGTTTTYEMASDVSAASIVTDSYGVNIENVTSNDVGEDVDDSINWETIDDEEDDIDSDIDPAGGYGLHSHI